MHAQLDDVGWRDIMFVLHACLLFPQRSQVFNRVEGRPPSTGRYVSVHICVQVENALCHTLRRRLLKPRPRELLKATNWHQALRIRVMTLFKKSNMPSQREWFTCSTSQNMYMQCIPPSCCTYLGSCQHVHWGCTCEGVVLVSTCVV